MVEIKQNISSYVEIQQTTMLKEEARRFDISAIDFDSLRREFAKVKKKNQIVNRKQDWFRILLFSVWMRRETEWWGR